MAELECSLTDIGWLNQKLISLKNLKKEVNSKDKNDETVKKFVLDCNKCLNNETNARESRKPLLSYSTLIMRALESSETGMMSLSEIYRSIAASHSYFHTCKPSSWKNSVRHNLSLHRCFRRVKRPPERPGKGSLWTIDYRYSALNSKKANRTLFLPKSISKREINVIENGAMKQEMNYLNGFNFSNEDSNTGSEKSDYSILKMEAVMNEENFDTFRSDYGTPEPTKEILEIQNSLSNSDSYSPQASFFDKSLDNLCKQVYTNYKTGSIFFIYFQI